jgi:hypothetical protein
MHDVRVPKDKLLFCHSAVEDSNRQRGSFFSPGRLLLRFADISEQIKVFKSAFLLVTTFASANDAAVLAPAEHEAESKSRLRVASS